jgi:hypothetical protein
MWAPEPRLTLGSGFFLPFRPLDTAPFSPQRFFSDGNGHKTADLVAFDDEPNLVYGCRKSNQR